MKRLLCCVVSLTLLPFAAARPSRAQEGTVDEVGISEDLGAKAALDAVLRDEEGNYITLRSLIDKPTILTLNYFRCAGICTPQLNGLVDAFNEIGLEPGRAFQVITVSFDPADTFEVAHQKRVNYLKQMKRAFPPAAWRFLTGEAPSTKAIADSVGYHFRPEGEGFVHPGAIMVLTPEGKVSRYIYGVTFLPADLEMAIDEAARGEVRPTVSRLLAFCYSYDPEGRRYVVSITRVAGAGILALAGGFVLYLLAAGRWRKRKEKAVE